MIRPSHWSYIVLKQDEIETVPSKWVLFFLFKVKKKKKEKKKKKVHNVAFMQGSSQTERSIYLSLNTYLTLKCKSLKIGQKYKDLF